MATISRKELLAELLPALDELFGKEYDERRPIGGNEFVHNVGGDTIDVNLSTDTQVPKEY